MQKGKDMARLIRVCIDVRGDLLYPPNYETVVWEKIRTAQPREILTVQHGQNIHEDDFDLTLQLVEDVLRSAVGRTLGIAQTLQF